MAGQEEVVELDVRYDLMIEWMVDRGTLPAKWSDAVQRSRKELDKLLVELPTDDAAITDNVRQLDEMSFFDCQRIFDRLLERAQERGDAGKSLLGNYSNAQLKSWDNLLRTFKKNNSFLGDAARLMVQRTDHEIPALQRDVSKQSAQLQDLTNKISEGTKNAASSERKLNESCAKMGIAGISYRAELKALAADLPKLVQEADSAVRVEEVETAAQMYEAFREFSAKVAGPQSRSSSKGKKKKKGRKEGATAPVEVEVLPNLNLFLALEAVETGEAADSAPSASAAATEPADAADGGEVDWGAMFDVAGTDTADADVAADASGADGGADIDWGALGGDDGGDGGGDAAQEVEIDWGALGGVEVDASGAGDTGEIDWGGLGGGEVELSLEGQEESKDQSASEISAFDSIKQHTERAKLLDDLLELQAFLRQRLGDMDDSANLALVDQFADAPDIVRSHTSAQVKLELDAVDAAIAALTSSRLYQLIMISEEGRYLDRLSDQFTRHKGQVAKHRRKAASAREELASVRTKVGKSYEKLKALIDVTLSLKKDSEGAISGLYEGRPVNIIGKINTLRTA